MQLGKKAWAKPEVKRISAGSAEQCNSANGKTAASNNDTNCNLKS